MSKIRVAIVGVGNCASSLVQGIYKYQGIADDTHVPGVMHNKIGSYRISDIEIVAAFDVNETKVGKDVSTAIYAEPNNTLRFFDVPFMGVTVQKGEVNDGIGQYLEEVITISKEKPVDVAQVLQERAVDVLINYLPVGSEKATVHYILAALESHVAVVNCIPVFIANNPEWNDVFIQAGVPIVGDDIKSQVGATIVHRVLANLFGDRGVDIDKTFQLNFGGNTDFLNMLERERLKSKKISKTQAVTSQIQHDIKANQVHVGPSDFVPWLKDEKWCEIYMNGELFGGAPMSVEVKLKVHDSPNSAGVVVDAVRCAKLALDRGIGGSVTAASAFFMKSPNIQYTDSEAKTMLEEFIRG